MTSRSLAISTRFVGRQLGCISWADRDVECCVTVSLQESPTGPCCRSLPSGGGGSMNISIADWLRVVRGNRMELRRHAGRETILNCKLAHHGLGGNAATSQNSHHTRAVPLPWPPPAPPRPCWGVATVHHQPHPRPQAADTAMDTKVTVVRLVRHGVDPCQPRNTTVPWPAR